MRRFLFAIASIVLFASCDIYTKASYDFKFRMVEPIQSNKLLYQDDTLGVVFDVKTDGIDIMIKNNLLIPIRVIWNNAAWVQDGKSQKIAHTGMYIKNIYKEETPPTIIPGNTTIKEGIGPADGVKYSEVKGSYIFKHYFIDNKLMASQAKFDVRNYIGNKLQILLPIEVNGKERYYTFAFVVDNVIPKK